MYIIAAVFTCISQEKLIKMFFFNSYCKN